MTSSESIKDRVEAAVFEAKAAMAAHTAALEALDRAQAGLVRAQAELKAAYAAQIEERENDRVVQQRAAKSASRLFAQSTAEINRFAF